MRKKALGTMEIEQDSYNGKISIIIIIIIILPSSLLVLLKSANHKLCNIFSTSIPKMEKKKQLWLKN